MIVVVGIGADGMSGLAPGSRAELARATVVHGSPRQLDLLDGTVSALRRPWPSPMLPALRTRVERRRLDAAHGRGGSITQRMATPAQLDSTHGETHGEGGG